MKSFLRPPRLRLARPLPAILSVTLSLAFTVTLSAAEAEAQTPGTEALHASAIPGVYILTHTTGPNTCANKITFASIRTLTSGADGIPHRLITEDGHPCVSTGTFIALPQHAVHDSGGDHILREQPIAAVSASLLASNTSFLIAFEQTKRNCPPGGGTPAFTIALFFETAVGDLPSPQIDGISDFIPGGKHMVVFSQMDGFCLYDFVADVPREVVNDNGAGDDEDDAAADKTPSNGDVDDLPSTAMTPSVIPVAPAVTPKHTTSPSQGPSPVAPSASAEASPITIGIHTQAPVQTGANGDTEETGAAATSDEADETVEPPSVAQSTHWLPACFPGDAQITLADGSRTRMDALRVGDFVATGVNRASSTVFSFAHRSVTALHTFVRLETESGASVTLSKGHYLPVSGRLLAARLVQLGDLVTLSDGREVVVTSVQMVSKRGLYNPQTLDGSNIVVNDVVTSIYTEHVRVETAHALLAPLRALFRTMGVSTSSLEGGLASLAFMAPLGAPSIAF